MANYNVIEDLSQIPKTGRCSVITTDAPSCNNPIPTEVVIDVYKDGEKIEDEQQCFDCLDEGILNAEFEEKVFVQADAEPTYNTLRELAEEFQNANRNPDVYADRLEERLREMSDEDSEEEDFDD